MKKILKALLAIFFLFVIAFVAASVFWLADLRPANVKNATQSEEQIQLAQSLLKSAIKKQGLDKISQFSTYELEGADDWKGFMGGMATPWEWNKDKIAMRFSVGDFDGQVEVLEGTQKGFIAGIQSWDYYEKRDAVFQSDVEDHQGKIFTLAAYHYFFELGNRLVNAPFIRYAGRETFKGKEMDKVFVSWGNERTKDYDHYLVWIGKESGLIEATAFTTRDNPKPAPAFMYGAMRFDDFRDVDGILIPFKQTAQLMNPKDDIDDYIHQLTIQAFAWDKPLQAAIRPLTGVAPVGDAKLQN